MVLRKDALGLQRGEDRYLRLLGEFSQLLAGIRVDRALSDVEQRLLGRHERTDGGPYVVGIGPRPPALDRRVRVIGLVVLAEVARNDEQDRAGPAGAKLREGAAGEVGDQFRAVDLADPLGDRLQGL